MRRSRGCFDSLVVSGCGCRCVQDVACPGCRGGTWAGTQHRSEQRARSLLATTVMAGVRVVGLF